MSALVEICSFATVISTTECRTRARREAGLARRGHASSFWDVDAIETRAARADGCVRLRDARQVAARELAGMVAAEVVKSALDKLVDAIKLFFRTRPRG